jgi:hypothetical protein
MKAQTDIDGSVDLSPGSEELEECSYGQRRLAEGAQEGHGSHKTVMPMMMNSNN